MSRMSREELRKRRHIRLRHKISGTTSHPRLNIYRSLVNIYAQIVDDTQGVTLTSASTIDAEVKALIQDKTKSEAAKVVGQVVAKRAQEAGITTVVFDRGGYKYHGRIKALADAAREAGLKF